MRKKSVITLDDAKQMMAAAETEAVRNGWDIVVAVLDDGAHLVGLHRMDGARPGNPEIAIQKARTSALTLRSSKVWEDWINDGRMSILGMPVLSVQGGLPIIVDGECLGSIGISGVTSAQDEQVARVAIQSVFPTAEFVRPKDKH